MDIDAYPEFIIVDISSTRELLKGVLEHDLNYFTAYQLIMEIFLSVKSSQGIPDATFGTIQLLLDSISMEYSGLEYGDFQDYYDLLFNFSHTLVDELFGVFSRWNLYALDDYLYYELSDITPLSLVLKKYDTKVRLI